MEPTLGRYPAHLELPVQWGDMDAFAHVNNTVYLRWFESARIAYFEAISVAQVLGSSSVVPILARASVDYRQPVTYPDRVRIDATVTKLGNTSFTMAYRAFSHTKRALVAEGEAIVVMLDAASGQKTPLSPALRDAIAAFEATGSGPG